MRRDRKPLSFALPSVGTLSTDPNGTTPTGTDALLAPFPSVAITVIGSPDAAATVVLKLPLAATATPLVVAAVVASRTPILGGAPPGVAAGAPRPGPPR